MKLGIMIHMSQWYYQRLFQFVIFSVAATIDHVTCISCVRADGKMFSTFLIYSKCIPAFSTHATQPNDWLYGTSPNGETLVYSFE